MESEKEGDRYYSVPLQNKQYTHKETFVWNIIIQNCMWDATYEMFLYWNLHKSKASSSPEHQKSLQPQVYTEKIIAKMKHKEPKYHSHTMTWKDFQSNRVILYCKAWRQIAEEKGFFLCSSPFPIILCAYHRVHQSFIGRGLWTPAIYFKEVIR